MERIEKYYKGVAEGKEIANRELIMRALKKGKTVEEVADFLGFPIEYVLKVEIYLNDE